MVCPSGEELLAFHLGELAEAQIRSVGEHLTDCARCEDQARRLDGQSDTVLSALRRSGEIGVTPPSDRSAAAPSIPSYEILGLAGKGGMGVVYKARHQRLDRLVALKILRADGVPHLERFQAEARAVGRLQHPNIVQIFEVGEWQGQLYLTLEFLDGGTLADRLEGKPHDARATAALVQILARAVHYAHTQGIVHRDLKPANVLLQISELRMQNEELQETNSRAAPAHSSFFILNSAIPKIADFGIAKHLQVSGQTREGDIIGTAQYMAPEQAAGKGSDIGPASDIYSLGVILYEMLTGRVPLQGATDLETVQLVQNGEPVPPRRLQPGLPRDLETISLKCLRKEPAARYATAEDLAVDLGRHLAGEPIAARPTPMWERAWKWTKRRPALAAVVALAAFIVGVGFPGTTYLWMQADHARAEELEHRQKAEAETRRADDERAVAQAVNDFLLKDLLGQAYIGNQPFGVNSPERNPKITVRELLDRADKAVVGKFADQPLVEAAVQQTLADTYGALGEFALAIPHAERALDLRRAQLGPDHGNTLESLNNLGMLLLVNGNVKKGTEILEQVLQTRQTRCGPDAPETLVTKQHLAIAYLIGKKSTDAINLLEQVRAVRVKNPGLHHRDTQKTLSILASAYSTVGNTNGAIEILLSVREAMSKDYRPDDPETVLTLGGLGEAYLRAGKTAEAIAMLTKAHATFVRTQNEEHPHALAILTNLAAAHQADRNLKQALPLFQQAAAGVEKLKFSHVSARDIVGNLSGCLEELNLYADAELWRRKWLAVVKEKVAIAPGLYAGALLELGDNLLKQKRHAEAEPFLREAVPILQKVQPYAWTTFMAQSLLGGALLGQKKYPEAEPLLLAGYEGMQRRERTISPPNQFRLAEALERLVRLYDAGDMKDKADEWRKKLEQR